jgi:hypothetical protein
VQDAAIYGAKGLVLWEIGAPVVTLRGGRNAATGRLSTLDVAPVSRWPAVPGARRNSARRRWSGA